jgi:hypothetical protein
MVPLTAGVDPELAWTIRGIVWPVMAILAVAPGGFRKSCRARHNPLA